MAQAALQRALGKRKAPPGHHRAGGRGAYAGGICGSVRAVSLSGRRDGEFLIRRLRQTAVGCGTTDRARLAGMGNEQRNVAPRFAAGGLYAVLRKQHVRLGMEKNVAYLRCIARRKCSDDRNGR